MNVIRPPTSLFFHSYSGNDTLAANISVAENNAQRSSMEKGLFNH
jgi:hypothetical protein